MGRRFIASEIAILLLFLLADFSASAQDKSFGSRLGYSVELMGEGFAKDFSTFSLDLKIRYNVTPSFSVFIPIAGSELLYNKTTTRNYDFAGMTGAGMRLRHSLSWEDDIAVSVAGMSTIGKGSGNYWQIRAMGEYVMPTVMGYGTFIGAGVEYRHTYKGSSSINGFFPVISIGFILEHPSYSKH